MSAGDRFQLDAFNFDTNEYECVEVRCDSFELTECARLLGLKSWRVWNRTKRAERDQMLPPGVRIVKTVNHSRRWASVHRAPLRTSTTYKEYSP